MPRVYKSIQLPAHFSVKPGQSNPVGDYVNDILNAQARDGWTFQVTAQASQLEPVGCFAALFGAKNVYSTLNVLIFFKDTP